MFLVTVKWSGNALRVWFGDSKCSHATINAGWPRNDPATVILPSDRILLYIRDIL
jgi:hypothetical protein